MMAILIVSSHEMQLSHAQGNDLKNTILNGHNQERAQVNVPALQWSDSLAADAQNYAAYLTSLGLGPEAIAPHAKFDINNPQGENLAWGASGFFSPEQLMQ